MIANVRKLKRVHERRICHDVSGLWVDKMGVHRHREEDQERAVAVECYSQLVSSRDDLGNSQARWSRRGPPGQSTPHLATSSSGRDEDGGGGGAGSSPNSNCFGAHESSILPT